VWRIGGVCRRRAAITGAVFMKFGRAPTTDITCRTGLMARA